MLSVGSNLGDRLGTLQGCVQAIGGVPDTDVLAVSPVYETAPVGGPAQPDYLNAVLIAATGLRPLDLLAAPDGTPRPFGDCDGATVAISALAAAAGAWCVRVHQVPPNADAVRVAAAWRAAAAAGAGPPLSVTGRS